ncbi:hypothetical protein ES705_30341 [subsurface metagenome]
MSRDSIPQEDQVRRARNSGATYRELAQEFHLNFNQIKGILHGEDYSEISKLKNEKIKLENEIGYMKTSLDKISLQYREYLEYRPHFEAVEAIEREGGRKSHLIRICFGHLKRSGVSDHDLDMFLKRRKLRALEVEASRLGVS